MQFIQRVYSFDNFLISYGNPFFSIPHVSIAFMASSAMVFSEAMLSLRDGFVYIGNKCSEACSWLTNVVSFRENVVNENSR
jgi:hypothetical protein